MQRPAKRQKGPRQSRSRTASAEEAQEAQEQHKQDTPSGKQAGAHGRLLTDLLELSSMVQPGDAVEFVVAASSHGRRAAQRRAAAAAAATVRQR